MASQRSELFSFLLSLSAVGPEPIGSIAASQVQVAFLDMVRQVDPALSEWLKASDRRAPYTVALLQGLDLLLASWLEGPGVNRQIVPARSSRVCWLSITVLDAALFSSFTQYLIALSDTLTVHIGERHFRVGCMTTISDLNAAAQSLVAYSSFEDLYAMRFAQRQYRFDFVSPTLLYCRQRPWGRTLQTFPEAQDVFESLARQWELFAPAHLCMRMHDLSVRAFSLWCEQNIEVACYAPAAEYRRWPRADQVGFQGTVVYEVKGKLTAPEARWLSPLARFATFSGVGCKTAIGMGRARCTNLVEAALPVVKEEMQ